MTDFQSAIVLKRKLITVAKARAMARSYRFDRLRRLFTSTIRSCKSLQVEFSAVDISKVFFEMVIWKFEFSQVSQAVTQLEIADR
jgi:hypothetical protein